MDNYLRLAKDRYGYTADQALGMLYYHHYDITKAVTDLANFCPLKGFIDLYNAMSCVTLMSYSFRGMVH